MSTVAYADFPSIATPFRPVSVAVLRAESDAIVWRQVLSTGATYDMYYIGSFQYANPGELNSVTGTVTEVKGVVNGEFDTFHWSGFSTPLDVMDNADMTVGGWEAFYRTTLLPGDDLITSSRSLDERLNGYDGDDTISSGPGADYLRGDAGDDSISGGADFDDINGNQGNDTAHGNGGNDWMVGGKDNDLLFGEDGDDIVYGNLGNDTGDGGSGVDIVRGGQGDDSLTGGAGDDFISGDRGADTVSGGADADIFHSFSDAGIDRVIDFSRAEGDRVVLDPGTIYSVIQVEADTVINVDGGAQMILVGVQMSSLTGDWISAA